MSENSTRPIAGHAIAMALIAWSMLAAAGGVLRTDNEPARLLLVVWVALGAWLLARRWRSRP